MFVEKQSKVKSLVQKHSKQVQNMDSMDENSSHAPLFLKMKLKYPMIFTNLILYFFFNSTTRYHSLVKLFIDLASEYLTDPNPIIHLQLDTDLYPNLLDHNSRSPLSHFSLPNSNFQNREKDQEFPPLISSFPDLCSSQSR